MTTKLDRIFLSSVFLLASAIPATAEMTIRVDVEATVDNVFDPVDILGDTVLVGDSLEGLVQYSTGLTDLDPDPTIGFYDGVPIEENFMEGSNEASGFFQTTLFFDVTVSDGVNGSDVIEFFASGDTTPSTLDVAGIQFVDLVLTLTDTDGTVLQDDSLPTNFDLADFESAQIVLSGEDSQDFVYFVEASITSLSITAIPEPGSSFAMLIVAGSVAIRRRPRPTPAN